MIYWIIVAFILDLLIGDPYSWPHPIKLIGNFIAWFHIRINLYGKHFTEEKEYDTTILPILWDKIR